MRDLFSSYGAIESLKFFEQKGKKQPFAFVCFKTPEVAKFVKNANININGRPLFINYYESK